MLTFFSNALRTSTGACWMASVKASSSVLSNSVTSNCSNSCSAWSTVKALRMAGLDTSWVICSLLISAGIVAGNEIGGACDPVPGVSTGSVVGGIGSVVSTKRVVSGATKVGAVVLERGTRGTVIDVGGAVVSSGGGTVSGGRVSVVRGISIFGIDVDTGTGRVVSMGRTSIGCAIVPVGTATTGSITGRTTGVVIGAI